MAKKKTAHTTSALAPMLSIDTLEADVRVVLRSTTDLTAEPSAAIARDVVCAADDYLVRIRLQHGDGRARAFAYAEDIEQALDAVLRVMQRRQRTLERRDGSTVVVGMAPETIWSLQVHRKLRPVLLTWKTAAAEEAARWRQAKHRPLDEPRLRLECEVADALAAGGVAPTSSRDQVFVRVLRDAVYPALQFEKKDAHHAAARALKVLDEWRALPEHRRYLCRA